MKNSPVRFRRSKRLQAQKAKEQEAQKEEAPLPPIPPPDTGFLESLTNAAVAVPMAGQSLSELPMSSAEESFQKVEPVENCHVGSPENTSSTGPGDVETDEQADQREKKLTRGERKNAMMKKIDAVEKRIERVKPALAKKTKVEKTQSEDLETPPAVEVKPETIEQKVQKGTEDLLHSITGKRPQSEENDPAGNTSKKSKPDFKEDIHEDIQEDINVVNMKNSPVRFRRSKRLQAQKAKEQEAQKEEAPLPPIPPPDTGFLESLANAAVAVPMAGQSLSELPMSSAEESFQKVEPVENCHVGSPENTSSTGPGDVETDEQADQREKKLTRAERKNGMMKKCDAVERVKPALARLEAKKTKVEKTQSEDLETPPAVEVKPETIEQKVQKGTEDLLRSITGKRPQSEENDPAGNTAKVKKPDFKEDIHEDIQEDINAEFDPSLNVDVSDSDSDSLPEMLTRIKEDLQNFQLSEGDLVWARVKGWPYWPGLIRKVYRKGKKQKISTVTVLFLNDVYSSSREPKHRLRFLDSRAKPVVFPFRCSLREKFERIGYAGPHKQVIQEAVKQGDDFLTKTVLGIIKTDAYSFFFPNSHELLEDDSEKKDVIPGMGSQDPLCSVDSASSASSDSSEPVLSESIILRNEQRKARCEKLVTFIKSDEMKEYLTQIFHETRASDLHAKMVRGTQKERDSLKFQGYGPVHDEEQLDEILNTLMPWMNEIRYRDLGNVGYVMDVWMKEAIVYALISVEEYDRDRAWEVFWSREFPDDQGGIQPGS